MTFSLQQLEEIVLVLENEQEFYKQYTNKFSSYNDTYGKRRNIIAHWLVVAPTPWASPRIRTWPAWVGKNTVEDRDQIRRYFDERYEIPQTEVNKYAEIASVWNKPKEMPVPEPNWKDELRAARDAGATLQMLNDDSQWVDEHSTEHPNYFIFDLRRLRYRIKPSAFPTHVPKYPNPVPSPEYLAEWQGTQPTPKEPTMAKPIEITVVTYANGADIAKMTNAEVFDLIASEEAAIEKLKQIKAHPKKLVAEIAKRQAGVDALVAHLDKTEV